MPHYTAEQLQAAMIQADITWLPHHNCGLCGFTVGYSREDTSLFFCPACDCTPYSASPEPRRWEELADWINMQTETVTAQLAAQCGIVPDTTAQHDPVILQEEDTDNGHLHIEATEDPHGIVLHECLDDGHGGMEYAYMGRLSLDAWHALAEMFLLRHPQAARAMVAKWQTLLAPQPREEA